MTVRRKRPKDLAVYFCTFTCWQWLSLFKEANAYDAVYAWMDVATAKGFRFLGYVIMPNHAHFVIYVPEGKEINAMLATGKRYMAYAIVAALQALGRTELLAQLQNGLRPSDVERGQKHRVFETSSDIKECFDGKMIDQKLRYIHANPVSKKWRLVDDAVAYPHSSFAFYTHGDARKAPLLAYQELGYLKR